MQVCSPVGFMGGGGYVTITPGTVYALEAVAADWMDSSLSGSTLLAAYSTSAGNCRAVLSSVAGTVVTPGTPATVFTVASPLSSQGVGCALLSSTSGFVAYKQRNSGSGTEMLYGAALALSGTSITTVGTSALINNDSVGGFVDAAALTVTQALVVSRSGSTDGKVHLITVSGTSFSVTDSETISNFSSGRLLRISGSQAILTYNGGSTARWREAVISISAGNITIGTPTEIDTRTTNAGQGGSGLLSSSITGAFYIGNDLGIAQLCSFSGTSITAGTAYTYASAVTSASVAGCALPPSQLLGLYRDNADNTAKAKILTGSGTAITSATSATSIHTAAAAFDAPQAYTTDNNLALVPALYTGQPGAQVITLS